MKPETKYAWHPLKRELDKLGWDYDRIENGAGPGMPDLCIWTPKQKTVWVELKYVPDFDALTVNVGLRPEQFIWLRQAVMSKRDVYLLACLDIPGRRNFKEWYCWSNIRGFELAKHPCAWSEIAKQGSRVNSLEDFLLEL